MGKPAQEGIPSLPSAYNRALVVTNSEPWYKPGESVNLMG